MSSKQTLRNEARARRAELAAATPDFAASLARYAGSLALASDRVIAGYWPIRDEADPRALASALAARGHPIALPVIAGPEAALAFRPWRDESDLAPNRHGIHEPPAHLETVAPHVLLVPLLAFDADGVRLGYGGGYYDRTLAELRNHGHIVAIGVAYAGQEVAKLPHDAHDQRLDAVVTERGFRKFGQACAFFSSAT
jgi:5-formyltetrahydrofolate cyclo-ligase